MRKLSIILIISVLLSLVFAFNIFAGQFYYDVGIDNSEPENVTVYKHEITMPSSETDTESGQETESETELDSGPETEPVELSYITVTPPEKTIYHVGDTLDVDGMKVYAVYSDNSQTDVTGEAVVDVTKLNSVGNITVTVEYQGKTAIFRVKVEEAPVAPAISFFFTSSAFGDVELEDIDGKTNVKVNDVFGVQFDCDILDMNGNKVTSSYAEKYIYLCKDSPDISNAVEFTATLTSSKLSEDFILIFPAENLDYNTTYYFHIEPNKFKNAQGDILGESEPAEFTTCSKRSDIEYNDSFSWAQEIDVFTESITGTLSSNDKVDWYKIKIPCNNRYRFWGSIIESISISRSTTGSRVVVGFRRSADNYFNDFQAVSSSEKNDTFTMAESSWDTIQYPFETDQYYYLGVGFYDLSGYSTTNYTITFNRTHTTQTRDEYSEKIVKKATCTEQGLLEYYCSECNVFLKSYSIPKIDHEYGEWITIAEPTKDKKGTMARYCSMCKKEETKSVSLIHGEYGEWIVDKEATCTEKGLKSFYCRCCNKAINTLSVPITDHEFNPWQTDIAAMPEKNGVQSRYCKHCNVKVTESTKYNFSDLKKAVKIPHAFSDVKNDAWYNGVVADCYHYALMMGNSNTTFNPTGNITLAEVITVAVRIWCLKNPYNSKPDLTEHPWYKGYVDFAIKKDIIQENDFDDYNRPATRAEMAYILKNSVPQNALGIINNINEIPDVERSDEYGEEILALYRAGVLGGSDENGTFFPDRNITRAEGAAIIARLTEISDRVKK